MPKNFWKNFVGMIALAFLAGCGVQARSYVQVKDRVDQEIVGNAGYFGGTPSAEAVDRSQIRKTRKVYVLEMSKADNPEEDTVASPSAAPASENTEAYIPADDADDEPYQRRIVLPDFEDDTVAPAESSPVGPTTATDYTVMKDDTLQKISKQFYDSYSKWPTIYEANKDKIADPNRIKPGITITIPPLQ